MNIQFLFIINIIEYHWRKKYWYWLEVITIYINLDDNAWDGLQ